MPSLLQLLRDTNCSLRSCLHDIAAKQEAGIVPPDKMNALLSGLLAAGAGLRAHRLRVAENDRELDTELAEYRRQIELLRDLLPSIQRALLAEKSRIEGQRLRVQSATEWVRASRQTL